MAQITDERIRELDPLSTDELTKVIRSATEAAKWTVPLDHTPATGETDKGTLQIPVSRLGILTASRLVPQSMLPNQVSEIKFGDMDTSGTTWVFTETSTGNKYAAPDPSQVSGATAPDIDTVYIDNSPSTEYNQYRFVEAASPTTTDVGLFVPIPSDLIMVDGKGTTVTDNKSDYTRKIDVVIGTPSQEPASGTNMLFVNSNNQLVHSTTGAAGSYGSAATPGFGQTFNVPSFTVNSTGHITGAEYKTVKIPDTAATSGTQGLVRIGTTAEDIKTSSSGGTPATSGGYVLVSAADHTHKAYLLTLSNNNVSGGTKYRGTSDVTYDFTNVLKCTLPTSAPTASTNVLTYDGTKAAWADMETLMVPRLATVTGSISGSTVTYTASDNGNGLSISVSGTTLTLTGAISGHVYHVSYGIQCKASAPSNYLYTATVALANSGKSVEHLLNGSFSTGSPYAGIPLNENGMFTFIAPASGTLTFSVSVDTTGQSVTWTSFFTSIEVAEIK